MASLQKLSTNVILRGNPITVYPGVGAVIQASRRTRPYWFDGRFLAARDMVRDQQFFLQRQRALGRMAGPGVIHGLIVQQSTVANQPPDPETLIIRAGQGITPDGRLVVLPTDLTIRISDIADEENLDVQFGLSTRPTAITRTRSGLYILSLRPVEFSANPITAYPTSLQGSPTTHDGDIVEAAAVSLVPFAEPVNNHDANTRNAAAARQIFVAEDTASPSGELLPLAMISIQGNAIEWIDPYLVRRDAGPIGSGLRFGLLDPAAQQAFLMQYDAQLLQAVANLKQKNLPAPFAAIDYFQALPAAGRFPLASINTALLTQLYFPQQTDVTLALIAQDELPAVIEDSLSLPPIDLTLAASAYADLSVFLLVPVPRARYATLAATLAPTVLTAALPQVVSPRAPVKLLRFFNGPTLTAAASGAGWSQVTQGMIYGYFVRRPSAPIFVTPVTSTTVTTLTSEGSDVAGVTLTATVSPSAATGLMTFKDGSTTLGTATLTGGVANLVLQPLAPGSHSFTVAYPGDANFSGSASDPLNVTLTQD
jgi:hypothetical protein